MPSKLVTTGKRDSWPSERTETPLLRALVTYKALKNRFWTPRENGAYTAPFWHHVFSRCLNGAYLAPKTARGKTIPSTMAPLDRKRKAVTVYRYPVRFTQAQLAVASNLLASTGLANMSQLVHFAFAQLAKTALGSPQEPAQAATDPNLADSDPDLKNDF